MSSETSVEQKISDAIESLEDIERSIKSGSEVNQVDLLSLKQTLNEASEDLRRKRMDRSEGPIIVKNAEGIIACVTWQQDHEVVDVIAESCGYPAIKEREQQALETIQNLMGAFDNPIVRRKCRSEFTDQAIAEGRRYLEAHTPDDDDEENPLLEGLKDV